MAGGPAPGLGEGPLPLMVQASRHGKERALARPFRLGLGLELVVADQIDSDHFGTFSGERLRPADAATTCRLKAEAALDATGASLGLASEGSFGPHPAIPFPPPGDRMDDLRGSPPRLGDQRAAQGTTHQLQPLRGRGWR